MRDVLRRPQWLGRLLRVHGPGRLIVELGLLNGQMAFYTAVVGDPGEILTLSMDQLRDLVTRESNLGDVVLRACLGRRALLVGRGAGFRIIGTRYSPDTRRLREFAARNRLPHRWIDLETDEEAEALLRRLRGWSGADAAGDLAGHDPPSTGPARDKPAGPAAGRPPSTPSTSPSTADSAQHATNLNNPSYTVDWPVPGHGSGGCHSNIKIVASSLSSLC